MLTRSATHAVRAMVALAGLQAGEYAQTSRVAEEAGIPRNYLSKILFQLSRRGLVESQRGLGGGFRLSRDAAQISLYDVIDSVEDVARWNECAFGEKTCTEERPCALHHRWGRVRDAYFNLLHNTFVGELIGNGPIRDLPELAALNLQRRRQ
jgi:Rrf2 family transcriptional regulator, iron-sulfur cluster assembly transcription factor